MISQCSFCSQCRLVNQSNQSFHIPSTFISEVNMDDNSTSKFVIVIIGSFGYYLVPFLVPYCMWGLGSLQWCCLLTHVYIHGLTSIIEATKICQFSQGWVHLFT